MIDVTDRHWRMLIRCISPLPTVWSEMTWDRAILYNAPGEPEQQRNAGNPAARSVEALIGFSAEEHPVVLQLGGAEPEPLARAARLGAIRGYDEINLNCGCPAQTKGRSKNCYGARLMKEPERVASCCAAMVAAVAKAASDGELGGRTPPPITVKCRLGVDKVDSYEELTHFISTVAAAGVTHFIVHARKALLNLNTIQNRSVPPLRHDWVFALVGEFPQLTFTLNGGVASVEEAHALLERGVHGVMVGRKANSDPYHIFARSGLLFGADEQQQQSGQQQSEQQQSGQQQSGQQQSEQQQSGQQQSGQQQSGPPSRREVLQAYLKYAAKAEAGNWEENEREESMVRSIIMPLTGLFHNTCCGPSWRARVAALQQDREALTSGVGVTALVTRCLEDVGVPNKLLDDRPTLQLHLNAEGKPYLPKPKTREEWLAEEGIVVGEGGEAAARGAVAAEQQPAWKVTSRPAQRQKQKRQAKQKKENEAAAASAASEGVEGDGEAECCPPAPPRRRSGKGEEENERILEMEANEAARRYLLLGAAAALLVAAAAHLVRARRVGR